MNPSNAPTPVTLSNGSVVIVTPLSERDMMAIFNFVRQKELTRLLTAIPKDVDVETKKMMVKLAYEQSNQFNISGSSAIWQDYDVMRQAFYFALRKETVGMTPEKVDVILESDVDKSAVLSALNNAPQDDSDSDSGTGDEEQKKTE